MVKTNHFQRPVAQAPDPVTSRNADCAATRQIGEHEYGTLHLSPEIILKDGGQLMELLGTSIQGVNAGEGKTAAIVKLVGALVSQMGSPIVMRVIENMMSVARVDGRKLEGQGWRMHFRGKQKDMIDVIVWLAEVHYADFFGGVASRLQQAASAAGVSLDSPAPPASPSQVP
jgi:hypothetical protein